MTSQAEHADSKDGHLSESSSLRIQTAEGVAVVTLDRPERLNAIDDELHSRLVGLWEQLAVRLDVRAVVLTGAGRAFTAGGDKSAMPFGDGDAQRLRRVNMREVASLVENMVNFPLPVIAAVNGPAVGLGATLVSLCDLAVMAEGAFLSDPHVSLGIAAGDGGAITWPFSVSLMRAKEFLFLGDRVGAADALALGMVNRVVPQADVLPVSMDLARRLAAQPLQALQQTKKILNQHLRQATAAMLDFAVLAETESFGLAAREQS
jgi:enoyl-CoA hydratase/carnithine racemase